MSPPGDPNELRRIIAKRQLTAVFQPIVDLQKPQVYGYEALIRGPSDSFFHNPLKLFDTATHHHLLISLEEACLDVACQQYSQHQAAGKLFLNLSPTSLLEAENRDQLNKWLAEHHGLPPEQIVIELSEQYPLHDYESIRSAIKGFRSQGFRIAIDDLGAGYAGLRAWSELRPDFVKIDRHFIENIHQDPAKHEFVRSIRDIARELGSVVIAEGIETAEELQVIQELNIPLGQGFFIGRPAPTLETCQSVLNRVQPLSQRSQLTQRMGHRVGEITLASSTVDSSTTLNTVVDTFQKNRWMTCLPIVDDGTPVGIIDRPNILELFSQRYSRELHGRKPIRQFMNANPVIVEDSTLLEDVSRLLTNDLDERMALDFIVTSNQRFYGIAKTSTLLKRITDQQIRNARYANPLTLLPGNVPLYEYMEQQLAQNNSFCVAYFDIDNFKPFNDNYGYSRGDEVIIALSKVLLSNRRCNDDFIAHIGGDDFVMILGCGDCEQRCQKIIDQFRNTNEQFYCASARKEGGIWGSNRTGEEQFFPLMSLSVGMVCPDPAHCKSFHDVAALAVEAKQQAKQIKGDSIFYSRRRKPQKPVDKSENI